MVETSMAKVHFFNASLRMTPAFSLNALNMLNAVAW